VLRHPGAGLGLGSPDDWDVSVGHIPQCADRPLCATYDAKSKFAKTAAHSGRDVVRVEPISGEELLSREDPSRGREIEVGLGSLA
jgi:hypothetical protein